MTRRIIVAVIALLMMAVLFSCISHDVDAEKDIQETTETINDGIDWDDPQTENITGADSSASNISTNETNNTEAERKQDGVEINADEKPVQKNDSAVNSEENEADKEKQPISENTSTEISGNADIGSGGTIEWE